MQNKTIGYKALTAIYQPDAVFVEPNSKDYSLTQEILSRLSHVPVYEIAVSYTHLTLPTKA